MKEEIIISHSIKYEDLYENDKVSEYSKIEEFNNDKDIREIFITTLESSEQFTESEESDSKTITEEDYVIV